MLATCTTRVRRAGLRAALLALPLTVALAPAARGQDTRADAEAWARAMVDHPAAADGDVDTQCRDLLARVAADPAHPLADAALGVIQLSQSSLHDPAAFARALEALPADGLSPPAARRLGLLVGASRAARAPLEALPDDLYPDTPGHAFLLAPLAPRGHELAFRSPLPQLTEPGFDREHEGVDGPVRWRDLVRPARQRLLQPSDLVVSGRGQVLSAVLFDAPGGGPAFVEVEARTSGGRPASYALSLNGETPIVVDRLLSPGSALATYGIALRDGLNRVTLQTALEQRARFALRVLGPDGRPRRVEVVTDRERLDRPLGRTTGDPPPASAPQTALDWLAGLDARGPDTEALLGLMLFHGDREPEGLAHVRRALELDPGRPGLTALLAGLVGRADYLPTSWKRSHKRRLAEEVLQSQPHRLDMALHVYGIMADEDREEEAITGLVALGEALPDQPGSRLALADVYGRLDMKVLAERALAEALAIAPDSPKVLNERAQWLESHGQRTRAAEMRLAAARAAGPSGSALRGLSDRFLEVGQAERALDLMREGVARDDDRSARLDLAGLLARLELYDEADAILAELAERHPDWERPCMERADVALRRGDYEGELAGLREALARRPSLRVARERLAALTGEDELRAWFEREAVDVDAAMAAYDDAGREDSVVRVLDHAVVHVFPDGGSQTLTQDVWRVRDLAGCEELGRMRPDGEVVRLAVVKPDGTEFEPVRSGGYVMPNLKPGDFVVSVRRSTSGPPSDGVVRLGSWTFANTGQPFLLSRYVVSVPDTLPLRLVKRQFDGTHETERADGAVVHRFHARDRARVLPEPHAPPPDWFLPWVEFGMDADTDILLAEMTAGLVEPTRVTPEVREAAQAAVEGVEGDTARARALHAFVNDRLDQRGWGSATAGLLEREGNASFLYAALLAAAGVPHELVWTRNVAPESDPEPDPPFIEAGYWRRKLLVRVDPRDGEPVWCDMDVKLLPFGELLGDAPGAPAVALPSQRLLTLPELPLGERPTLNVDMEVALSADGSADVDATLAFQAAPGWMLKEPVREIPQAFRKNWVTQMLVHFVPGVDVADYELEGLDGDARPLAVRGQGRVPTFLDDDGSSLTCALPFQTLDLAAQLGGGEGPRRLPFFLSEPLVQSSVVRLRLDDGLSAVSLPRGLVEQVRGGRYELSVESDDGRALTIRRQVAIPPFVIPAAEHAVFAAFCERVDEAERGVLRFLRDAP